jgi:hypothetical protein
MSDNDKDNLEGVEAIPVFDPTTSKFGWHKRPPAPPQQGYKTYSFEVEGGMGYVLGGFRVGSTQK